MTIWQRMDELNISRYQLSEACGLSWREISDICYGKVPLPQCDAEMLEKLAKSLNLSIETLLDLQAGPREGTAYLEIDLPSYLQKSIHDFIQGKLQQVSYFDCLYDDLYGSINSAQWGGDITKEQAEYLRKKYLVYDAEEDGQ